MGMQNKHIDGVTIPLAEMIMIVNITMYSSILKFDCITELYTQHIVVLQLFFPIFQTSNVSPYLTLRFLPTVGTTILLLFLPIVIIMPPGYFVLPGAYPLLTGEETLLLCPVLPGLLVVGGV
jgi:hypothetical protein